jgi:dolichol-phosphate mannosyltransferase
MIRSVIDAVGDPVEVIVVDDDSPDETWKVAAELDDPRVRAVHRKTRGLATAINRGIIEARGEIIGWMDADLSMPAEKLTEMIAQLETYPVVIGSRYVEGGIDDRPGFRVHTSRWINGLASLVLGGPVKDYDSGFIVIRREVLDQVTLLPVGYGAYFIDFLHSCRMKGIPILEVPYTLVDRTRGESKSAPNLIRFLLNGTGYVLMILFARLRQHS